MKILYQTEYSGRRLFLVHFSSDRIKSLYMTFYMSSGCNAEPGSVWPIRGVVDTEFIYGSFLKILYEKEHAINYDHVDGWIYKYHRDASSLESYWDVPAFQRFCQEYVHENPGEGEKIPYRKFMIVLDLLFEKSRTGTCNFYSASTPFRISDAEINEAISE